MSSRSSHSNAGNSPVANGERPALDLPYTMDWGSEPEVPFPSSTASSCRASGSPREQRLKRSVEDADLDQHESRVPAVHAPLTFSSQYLLPIEENFDQESPADFYGSHFSPGDFTGEDFDFLADGPSYSNEYQQEDLGVISLENLWTSLAANHTPEVTGTAGESHTVEVDHTEEVLQNPFADHLSRSAARFEHRVRASLPASGEEVNGYVKFRVERPHIDVHPTALSARVHSPLEGGVHHRTPQIGFLQTSILYLPEAFGLRWRPSGIDGELLNFYARAFCTGRTLLDKSNAYLEIMRMVDGSECVRHSVLALAAGYLLDYWPDSVEIRSKAIEHYHAAVQQLTHDLESLTFKDVGKNDTIAGTFIGNEDMTVGSLVLLLSDDIVNWEHREAAGPDAHVRHEPLWRQASQVARRILDASDPGQRYWHAKNVQTGEIWASNANMIAFAEICALSVTPLAVQEWDRLFPWLLGGSKDDVQRIHGGTGVSPKLLHIIAQITQLAALAFEDPRSIAFRVAADHIDQGLDSLRQWSQVSHGYDTVHELLEACSIGSLDAHGFVNDDGAMVTDLTAFRVIIVKSKRA